MNNGQSDQPIDTSDIDAEMEALRQQAMADPHYHGLGAGFQAYLDEHGINPERIHPDSYSCCIGFSEKEQKWYGWSHRAIYGFGIGDEVKRGHCAYVPTDPNDFLDDMRRFWDDDSHERTWAEHVDHNGELGVMVRWTYADDIENVKLRGTQGRNFHRYPDTWGRGEWTAKTLEDAKQMALDYYEGVA